MLLLEDKEYYIKSISFLVFYTFLLLFFCTQFSYLFGDFNVWPDVNIYYTIGKGMWFDKVPYKDLFDHKGPIIFFLYSIGYILSPNSFQGMFFLEGFFLSISLIFIYFLARLFLNNLASILTACLFLSSVFSFTSFGGSAEEFVLPLMVISLFLFIKYYISEDKIHHANFMFWHGFLLSIAFFIKLNLIIFWFFPILFIFIFLLYKRQYHSFFKNFGFLFIGILAVVFPVLLYFIVNNALGDFFEGYFFVNSKYGSAYSANFLDIISRIFVIFYKLSKVYFFSILFILIGLFSPFVLKIRLIGKISILFSFASLTLVIFLSQSFMQYYFIVCLVFIPLGIISIIYFIQKTINISLLYKRIFTFAIILISFLFTVKNTNFYGNSFSTLINRDFKHEDIDFLTKEVAKSKDKSLLCIGLHYSIDVFTREKIVPNIKYFFIPNISPESYPIIYDSQLGYIRNRKINFIIMNKDFLFKSLFINELFSSGYYPILDNTNFILYKKN